MMMFEVVVSCSPRKVGVEEGEKGWGGGRPSGV